MLVAEFDVASHPSFMQMAHVDITDAYVGLWLQMAYPCFGRERGHKIACVIQLISCVYC